MSFAGFIYDKLTWTSDTLHGAMSNGLGGKPAQVCLARHLKQIAKLSASPKKNQILSCIRD